MPTAFAISASAGMRGLWLGFADISPPTSGNASAQLASKIADDARYVFGKAKIPVWPWELDGTRISVASPDTVAAVFDRDCRSVVRDAAAFRRYIADVERSKDGVMTYCYDDTARTLTFVLFSTGGVERARVTTQIPEGQVAPPSLALEQRRAIIRALGTLFGPFNP